MFHVLFGLIEKKASGPLDTYHLHHLKLHAGNGFSNRVIGHVDALPFQGFVAFLAFVLEGNFVSLNHNRIDNPFPTLPLHMGSNLQHIRMGKLFVLLGKFFRI